jgi:hypothetical protein
MKLLPKQTTKPRPKISMAEILGADGLKLYKAAIEEEGKSRAFREAVFLRSVQHHDGPALDKKALLWVGGPSASGKTFAANSVFKTIAEAAPKEFEAIKNALIENIEKIQKQTAGYKPEFSYLVKQLSLLNSGQNSDEILQQLDRLQNAMKDLFPSDRPLTKEISKLLSDAKASMHQSLTKGNDVIFVDGGIELDKCC